MKYMISRFQKLLLAAVTASAFQMSHASIPAALNAPIADFASETSGVESRYAATTNKLVRQYFADIDALKARYQREGLLDELLAVQNEANRFATALASDPDPFEEIPEMPDDAIAASPEQLHSLQSDYVDNVRKAHDWRKSQIKNSSDKLFKNIETVQKDLTRRGKIDEAIEVRNAAEKLKTALAENRLEAALVELAKNMPKVPSGRQSATGAGGDQSAAPVAPRPRPAIAGQSANWKKWRYVGDKPFSPDLKGLYNPDLVSPIGVKVLEKAGYVYFSATQGPKQGQQIGGTLCDWSGQATEWNVLDPGDLPVKLKVVSETLALDGNRGPQLFVYVIGGEPMVQFMRVELMQRECEIKILRDTTDSTRFAIFWPKAGRSKPFTLQEGKPVKVVFGIALNGARQTCDASIQFLQN